MAANYEELREHADKSSPVYGTEYTVANNPVVIHIDDGFLCGTVELEYTRGGIHKNTIVIFPTYHLNVSGHKSGITPVSDLGLVAGDKIRLKAYIKHRGYVKYRISY